MRKLLLLSVVWLLLIGGTVALAARKPKPQSQKGLLYQVGGFLICKPPGMARGDSTDCVQLPPGTVLVIPIHPRDPLHES